MLTQCPKCETIFRLGAADLGPAQGFVECGECGEQFNALQRLADEPQFSLDPSVPGTAAAAPSSTDEPAVAPPPSGPAFVLLEAEETRTAIEQETADEITASVDPQDTFINLDPVAIESEKEMEQATLFAASAPSEPAQDPLLEVSPAAAMADQAAVNVGAAELPQAATLSESEHAILFTDPSTDYEDDPAPDIESIDIDDVPAILRAEVTALGRPQRTSLRWLWILLAILFIAGLSLQLTWIFRGRIMTAVPDAQPALLALCERLGCRIEMPRAPSAIELVARDVRDHPQYRDTLLVNATLASRSESATFFPIIQLGLYGQTGEVIGIRRFEPREYLDKSIDLAAGMPPNRPVYVVMEVAGVGSQAVSFEFTFL